MYAKLQIYRMLLEIQGQGGVTETWFPRSDSITQSDIHQALRELVVDGLVDVTSVAGRYPVRYQACTLMELVSKHVQ